MDEAERKALEAVRWDDWAPTADEVWRPVEGHVDGLNAKALDTVLAAFADADMSRARSPLGVAIVGQQGAGKTHTLSRAHEEVLRRGGYFFLVSLLHGKNFWQNIVHALLTGLRHRAAGAELQLDVVLRRFADRLALPADVRRQVTGADELTRATLDVTAAALARAEPEWGEECRHTARALVMLAARDTDTREIGDSYLRSGQEDEPGERRAWGIRGTPKPEHQVVREISQLLAFTGPSLLAIDQIDTLISQSGRSTESGDPSPVDLPRADLLAQIGTGLMDLREVTQRTVTVVACQPHSWEGIIGSQPSVGDRFRREARLQRVPSARVAQDLVSARFAPRFAAAGFVPVHPTWPVRPEAFATANRFTPRQLFVRIDDHIRWCLEVRKVVPLVSLDGGRTAAEPAPEQPPAEPVAEDGLARLDAEFDARVRDAEPADALDKANEDARMPVLLNAALRCHIMERDLPDCVVDRPQGSNPPMHARLRQILDLDSEDEIHWVFRAIGTPNARAAQNRIDALRREVGLDPEVPKRKAYVLRTGDWSLSTAKTRRVLADFAADGGVLIESVDLDDLKVFHALEQMSRKPTPELRAWLRERRPAGHTALLRAVFGEPEDEPPAELPSEPEPVPGDVWTEPERWPTDDLDAPEERPADEGDPDSIPLGTADGDAEVRISLESLRKHTVIFAGSGSGKTVLIRRLVEECALHGVSAIVLDPNNDLARLGDAWPRPPAGWRPGDAVKARDYLAGTEVLVWTPRRETGRPLSLQPLPDLLAVSGDPDEFGLALDTAVEALAPRARMGGTTAKAEQGRAVLREALSAFAREGGTGLDAFLYYLGDLPEEAATLARARPMAQEMSETLRANMINDPLFGGSGTPLDPGVLLTPAPGRRARISVISMIGLPTDQQRQSFVNQLQMALFAWIKRHPAAGRPLGGLFVMDEAQSLAPSEGKTACTASTLALASQARKYGLGLVFATQAPKGIHNRIVGNAATQFFGFINAPAQVAAAKEMAAAKAGSILDIGRLRAGQFYLADEGSEFRRLVAPMCLSHHPNSALSTEEVLARARG